ncbi:MAG: GNAT family N-acetyltransferase [Gemmatimonadota bacterium]|nr:GNAT family N-acetyltransferase [Gemmatimonadota bacterium]
MTRDGDDFEIERASREHLDALVPLFEGYRAFYGRERDPAAARAFLDERLESGDSVVFLARSDAGAVGFVQLFPSWSSVRMGRLWILNDLFVEPAARGRGVGRRLMERAREHAESTGAAGLVLETEKSNVSAAALYRSLGWEKERAFDRYELFLE